MSGGLVLSLCDRTGVMVRPWAEAGFDCLTVDLQEPPDTATRLGSWIVADVCDWLPPRRDYAIVFAFPPCTNLAVSGARWFRDKGLAGLVDGLRVVDRCRRIAEWSGAPWMLENPVSTLSTYWREPDFRFDPWEYALWGDGSEAYAKRTCLWTGGGFVLPERRPVEPVLGSLMHLMAPSATRADDRSVTPDGFARAVFAANVDRVRAAA